MSYGTYCLIICFFSLNNRSWKLFYIRTYSTTLFFEFSTEYFIGWICRSSFYCSNIAGHLDCFCFLPLQINTSVDILVQAQICLIPAWERFSRQYQ